MICIGLILLFLLSRFDKITPIEILEAVPEDAILFVEDLDYEYLTDGSDRVVAFGRWAGVVGAYNALRGLGSRLA